MIDINYLLAAFLVSLATQGLVIFLSKHKNLFIDSHESDKPQCFHENPTPRAGGIGIFLANLLVALNPFGLKFLLVSSIAFLSGILEDFHGNLTPRQRLLLQSLAAASGMIVLGAIASKMGFGFKLPVIAAILFTLVAIVGATNAINIIDGFNGLASGFVLIVLVFFSLAAATVEDWMLLNIFLLNICATLGFFIFNFPRGKIFLGDGGAYFLGFVVAQSAILLFERHDEISPWFCLAVMIYPIWEVIYSMYRRKVLKRVKSTEPDKMHLHQVIYRKITRSNPKTSVIIWLTALPFQAAAFFVMDNEWYLIAVCVAYCLFYVALYNWLVKARISANRPF